MTEAGEVISGSDSKISRIELGQSGLRLIDLNALIKFYGIPESEAAVLRNLAQAGRQRGRWSSHRDVIPTWFRMYLDLEEAASEIRCYQPEIIPGILQAENYMRVMHDVAGADPTETDRQVKLRLERRVIVERPNPPELGFILSESAIRRTVGDPATMSDQLQHLVEVSKLPTVTLQILPFNATTYETASFGFTILGLGEDSDLEVIYLEDFTSAAYLDAPDAVRAYTRLWNRLQAAALSPVESRKMIDHVADDFKSPA